MGLEGCHEIHIGPKCALQSLNDVDGGGDVDDDDNDMNDDHHLAVPLFGKEECLIFFLSFNMSKILLSSFQQIKHL